MTSCSFVHDDAAYVIGSLGPTERLTFESHLGGCPDCTRAVRDLAGLPSLLSRLDEAAFLEPAELTPVPDTLLPLVLGRVRHGRRRRRTVAVLAAVAVLVALFAALAWGPALPGGEPPAAAPSVPSQAMTRLDQEWLNAEVSMQQVAWGTRMSLTCTYAGGDDEGEPPSYALVVRSTDGVSQQVATWKAVPEATTTLDAATDLGADEITAVDVVLIPTGRRVLTLHPHA